MDSDVSLEIPSDTVIAYSILELEIRSSGHFGRCTCRSYMDSVFFCVPQCASVIAKCTFCVFPDLCLQPGTIGGFEADSSASSGPSYESGFNMVDGKCNGNMSQDKGGLSVQQNS